MPYSSISELPESVRKSLPKHAQEIFKEAFNNAWDTYDESSKRKHNASREVTSMKIAWNAVKKEYERVKPGHWRKK